MTSTTQEITTDEYEYISKKYRKAMIEHRGTGNIAAELLNQMLDILFKKYPNWSVKRAITRIHNDHEDLGYSRNYLYNFLNEEHREKIDSKFRRNGSKIGPSSSSTFFTETEQETMQRLQREKEEIEADAEKIRQKNGIGEEDKPDIPIDKRYTILQDKLKKANEKIEDDQEHIKRLQKEARFFKHGEIRLDYQKLQQCLRECNESPDFFIITQEKGNAIGVRAA